MLRTDVLVVGAGPVGLTAAIDLVGAGHHVLLVDAQPEAANTSRAAVIHPRTLEVLEPYGISERLVARGIRAARFAIRDHDRLLLTVPFGGLPTSCPYTLLLSQAETEAVLLERLHEIGGKVERPRRVVDLVQDGEGVTATFDDGEQVLAAHVVAADGMHSVIRERLGVAFTGGTYAESFTLADVRLAGGVPEAEVSLYFAPDGLVVVAPLPGGRFRIVATVTEAPKTPDVTFLQGLLDVRGPRAEPITVQEVVWGSRFRVHHRVAERFRVGRVLLAGDAGHVHSPAGGQGMNLGIEDGSQAGRAITAALAGDCGALDRYAARQRAQATDVVGLTSRLTTLATMNQAARPVRNLALSALGHLPPLTRRLAWQLAGLDRRQGEAQAPSGS